MKKCVVTIATRLLTAILVIAAVVGVCALTVHGPTKHKNTLVLKNIRTDKATFFYADSKPAFGGWFVEMVLAGTGESKAATENLKSIAATL